ncbi:hypothetical protein FS799_23690 [Agrobacterium vitis]|uniref:hypothetical protein n=1 Tax=Agrobacterium vitis TaxID=373 RepID=UPI001F33F14E|nr:hypothetical protein [Agrobacterium vitis]MCE6077842.1 hypothetical protein [Agrobacterium vitis]
MALAWLCFAGTLTDFGDFFFGHDINACGLKREFGYDTHSIKKQIATRAILIFCIQDSYKQDNSTIPGMVFLIFIK